MLSADTADSIHSTPVCPPSGWRVSATSSHLPSVALRLVFVLLFCFVFYLFVCLFEPGAHWFPWTGRLLNPKDPPVSTVHPEVRGQRCTTMSSCCMGAGGRNPGPQACVAITCSTEKGKKNPFWYIEIHLRYKFKLRRILHLKIVWFLKPKNQKESKAKYSNHKLDFQNHSTQIFACSNVPLPRVVFDLRPCTSGKNRVLSAAPSFYSLVKMGAKQNFLSERGWQEHNISTDELDARDPRAKSWLLLFLLVFVLFCYLKNYYSLPTFLLLIIWDFS